MIAILTFVCSLIFFGGIILLLFHKLLAYIPPIKSSKIDKRIERHFKSISGYQWKVYIFILLFIGAFFIILSTYTINHYTKTQIPILTETQGQTSTYDYNSWSSLLEFIEAKDGLLSFLFFLYGLSTILIGFYQWGKHERFTSLFVKSKERIKILNKFSFKTNSLLNEHSIYKSIIDLLQRCLEASHIESNKKKIRIRMLLCSPLLDSDGRLEPKDYKDWGKEFSDFIHNLANSVNEVQLEIYHLPNDVILGVNPLRNFTEVLATYLDNRTDTNETSTDIFEILWESTKNTIQRLENLKNVTNGRVSLNKEKLPDVPFQIILSDTPLLKEVVVSFAGRVNLENENVKEEPKGIHSVDPIVVDAFDTIFSDYVSTQSRIPIRPLHTNKIIKRIETDSTSIIEIKEYLKSINNDLYSKLSIGDINVKIDSKTFSPLIANSSKFTSRVIQESITKEDVFLEIGAGSGVQTILAYYALSALGNTDPKVFAIEPSNDAFAILTENCISNSVLRIDAITKTRETGVYLYKSQINIVTNELDCNADLVVDLGSSKISFVVADLPFVNIKECKNDLEKAFFDPNHSIQISTLNFFANNHSIKEDAKLLVSFSSLGGDIDIRFFELKIKSANLKIIKKVSFIEDDYEWITYIVMRKSSVEEDYWWNKLNVKSESSPST